MAQEIERKFLVTSHEFKSQSFKHTRIIQAYISKIPDRTVRLRIKGETAFITIKGEASDSGTTRYEWEKEIPINEATELLKICEPGTIDKTRYEVKAGNYTFEIDEFHGENSGLIVAEIELLNETDKFEKPIWLGEEVTGDIKYYNSELTNTPFSKW